MKKFFKREIWFYEQRAYPLGYIPRLARKRALEQLERLPKEVPLAKAQPLSAPVEGNVWTALGPAPLAGGQIGQDFGARPMSGRVADVAVDPSNSNHWLIGAAQGGIWETTNGGTTWTPRTDRQASLAMGAIAFAPSNPSIVYAGTGEAAFSGDSYFGAGLLRSTDGGATWQLLATTTQSGTPIFDNLTFSDIKVDPSNPNIVLAAVAGAGCAGRGCSETPDVNSPNFPGIWRSTNGGLTWNHELGAGTASGIQITDLEVDPTNFARMYAGEGDPFGVSTTLYRSINGGQSWAQVPGPWGTQDTGRVELAIAPSNPNVMYVGIQDSFSGGGNDGALLGLWRTDNAWAGSPTWAQIPTGPTDNNTGAGYCGWDLAYGFNSPQCSYDHELLVDPTDPNRLYAGGIALWRCSPCNATPAWTEISMTIDDPGTPGDERDNGIHVDQHTVAWAGTRLVVGNDGGVWSIADPGTCDPCLWSNHNTNLATIQFYDGVVHPTNPAVVMGGSQDNGTGRTTGSSTWNWIRGGDGADNIISTSDPDNDWAVSAQSLMLYRTIDGGFNYQVADNGIDMINRPFIARVEKCPSNDDVVIAGTDNVWRSDVFFSGDPNSPGFWVSNSPDLGNANTEITALAFAPSDTSCNTYAAGKNDGAIFLTTDGGSNWQSIAPCCNLPVRYITDIAFDPTNANVIYVTLSGFSEIAGTGRHLYRKTLPFSSWTNISPGVDIPHNTVVIDPANPNVIHVGTDVGILKSSNGGTSWSVLATNSGLPNVAIFDLAINATHSADPANNALIAFTHGRGAFRVTSQTFGPPGTIARVRLERSTGNFFTDGSINSGRSVGTSFNIGISADIAERINASESLKAGDLVELDPEQPKHYRKTRGAFSTLVAGVISTDPGIIMGNQALSTPRVNPVLVEPSFAFDREETLPLTLNLAELNESTGLLSGVSVAQVVPYWAFLDKTDERPVLALVGRVPVKVTTENGPIQPGDLLASSSKPGYAMRCSEAKKCEGAVIGKALEALDKGTGLILMLIMR
jgi:photosystem II stability/assembly factor-like uncharacterized protein